MAHFFNYENKEIPIGGLYKNQSCFLIVSGPSLNKLNLSLLDQPGIITLGVNNSVRTYRPDLWISVDDPANFMVSIWKDPKIQKFVMHGKRDKILWDNVAWKKSDTLVSNCPNVVYYRDNEYFKPTDEYLDENTFNWGNHTDRCECGFKRQKDAKGKKIRECPKCKQRLWGARSVMLAAVKLAYVLGFRKIFIIGADFKMDSDNKYAWQQNRSQGSIKNNNSAYARLNTRFDLLRPVFENRGLYVFNATPESELHSFVKISFEDAVKMALNEFPDTKNERTYGMYDRKAIDKTVNKKQQKVNEIKEKISKVNGDSPRFLKRLNQKLEIETEKLKVAIEEKETLLTWTA